MSDAVPSCVNALEYVRIFFKLQKTCNELQKRFEQMVQHIKKHHRAIYDRAEFHGVDSRTSVNGVIALFDAGADASTIPGHKTSDLEKHEAWRENTLDVANKSSIAAGKLRNNCALRPHINKIRRHFVPGPPPTSMVECFKTISLLLSVTAPRAYLNQMIRCSNAMALYDDIGSLATFVSLQGDLNILTVKTKTVLSNMASILEELRNCALMTAVFEGTASRLDTYPHAPEEIYIDKCIECGNQVALLDPHGYCSEPVKTEHGVSRNGVGCFHLCCAEIVGYRLRINMANEVTHRRVTGSNTYSAQGVHFTIGTCVLCGQQVSQYDDSCRSSNHGPHGPFFHVSCARVLNINCGDFLKDATANVGVGSVAETSAQVAAYKNRMHHASIRVCAAREARNALVVDPAASSSRAPAVRAAGPTASSSRAPAVRTSAPVASSSRAPAACAVVVKKEDPTPAQMVVKKEDPTPAQMATNLEIARSQKHFDNEPVFKSLCIMCNTAVTNQDTRGRDETGRYYHDSCALLSGLVQQKKTEGAGRCVFVYLLFVYLLFVYLMNYFESIQIV